MDFRENFIQRNGHRIYSREYPGTEPAIFLMHGFPDNLHLYDLIIPYLSPVRRVITFDFLGWGRSDKPSGHRYTASNQTIDLDAVISQSKIKKVVLVAHDASGPPAIDWALNHPDRVESLVLLNTYYCAMPTLRSPEAIFLFSTPVIRIVARYVSRLFNDWMFHRMFLWQVGKFFRDSTTRNEFLPILYQQFNNKPSAHQAFFGLCEDLLSTVRSRTKMIPRLKEFGQPVRIIFGDADPYLNKGVAQRFHELFPTSELFFVPGAKHFVQMDEPERVAHLILSSSLQER